MYWLSVKKKSSGRKVPKPRPNSGRSPRYGTIALYLTVRAWVLLSEFVRKEPNRVVMVPISPGTITLKQATEPSSRPIAAHRRSGFQRSTITRTTISAPMMEVRDTVSGRAPPISTTGPQRRRTLRCRRTGSKACCTAKGSRMASIPPNSRGCAVVERGRVKEPRSRVVIWATLDWRPGILISSAMLVAVKKS